MAIEVKVRLPVGPIGVARSFLARRIAGRFEVFEPSNKELDELRKATDLPLAILDISNGYGRIRLDDDGLIVLGEGKLKDLFPAE